jgi:phosphate-induced protein 1
MNKRWLFVLFSICPLLFIACMGDDTTALDGGMVIVDASHDINSPDTGNPQPDGYPSFTDGDDSDAGFQPDTSGCVSVSVPDNGLPYGGGPVILNTVNVYLIWYGDWSYAPKAPGLVNDLIVGLNASPILDINTGYYQLDGIGTDGGPVGYQFDHCGTIVYGDAGIDESPPPFWYPSYVSGKVQLVQSINDLYSLGANLQGNNIWDIVSSHLTDKSLPVDTNGVYFVLTSKDVVEGNECSIYCGYHSFYPFGNDTIKIAFVGDPIQCPGLCDEWALLEDAGGYDAALPTPNGDFSSDSMASIIFHELSEATTDPTSESWTGFEEESDECSWQYLTTYQTANGSPANQNLDGLNFLIQSQWVNFDGGYCALHL